MKDIQGHEYEALLAFQKDQLAIWKTRLTPALFAEMQAYCLATNSPAKTEQAKHQVYRGGDIIGIIMQWPTLASYYKPDPAKLEVVEDLI